jgi:hypothetical protein
MEPEERQKEAKISVGKETLKTVKSKIDINNLTPKDLKILHLEPENYAEILKETLKDLQIPQYLLDELKNPELLNNLIKEVQFKVVGEEDSIRTIFLCSCGRLVENSHLASFNLLVNSKSGTGKDFVVTAATSLWDKEVCIKRTRISPTAFTYWHDANIDPDWTWDGKILVLEDISENVLNSDVFKVMQSSGSIATIVINNKAKDIEIRGKPVIIITTARSSPDIELIRRNSICQLDESQELTRKILIEQAKKAMDGSVNNPNENLRRSLKYLNRVKVKIPYANKFIEFFPSDLIMRTAFNRFIDIIKASAGLYQHQRRKDKEGFILATGEDYNNALKVLNHLNREGNTITLTRDQQDILNVFKKVNELYSVDYINSQIPLTDKWLRVQLDRLTEMGFLQVDGIKDEKSNRIIRHYKRLTNLEKIYLIPFENLSKSEPPLPMETKFSSDEQ